MKIIGRFILFTVFLMLGTTVFAESRNGVHKNSFGIMFQIENVNRPLDNYTDGGFFGGRGGVGVRYWLLDELVLRGVTYLNFTTIAASNESATYIGLSAGLEYHFIKGIVSPYAGALAGLEFVSDSA